MRGARTSFSGGQPSCTARGLPSARAPLRFRIWALRARGRHLRARRAMLRCRRGDLRKPAESLAPPSGGSRCSRGHLRARPRTSRGGAARWPADARSSGSGARGRASRERALRDEKRRWKLRADSLSCGRPWERPSVPLRANGREAIPAATKPGATARSLVPSFTKASFRCVNAPARTKGSPRERGRSPFGQRSVPFRQ